MQEIVFDDKSRMPEEKELEKIIGKNFKQWKQIDEHVKENIGDTTADWKFYGKNYGWQLKTLLKKRNLFFRIPYQSCFKVVFVFGDRAVKVIEKSGISGDLIETLMNAKKYAEGRGLQIDIKNQKYMDDIKKLIQIKIEN